MSEQFEGVIFAKVDTDAQEQVTEECGVRTMPTFMAFKQGEKIGAMSGAIPAKLEVCCNSRLVLSINLSIITAVSNWSKTPVVYTNHPRKPPRRPQLPPCKVHCRLVSLKGASHRRSEEISCRNVNLSSD
jgi:hypothetical protein